MSKLIPNDTILRKYLPNQVITVKGEMSLYDKLAPSLDFAEHWAVETFLSESTASRIAGYSDSNPLLNITRTVVATEALRLGLPSLDLVLTPNGFGIVSNQTLSPASKERVDRLLGNLEVRRDAAIDSMIPLLVDAHAWRTTEQCRWFAQTLFPSPKSLKACISADRRWEDFLRLRPKIINIEESLAAEYFSPELMETLRRYALGIAEDTTPRFMLLSGIRSIVAEAVAGNPVPEKRCLDLIDFVRQLPKEFPEWHRSDVARLFDPPVFENKKKASGYFF